MAQERQLSHWQDSQNANRTVKLLNRDDLLFSRRFLVEKKVWPPLYVRQ